MAVRGSALMPQFPPDSLGTNGNGHATLHGWAATRAALVAQLGQYGIQPEPLEKQIMGFDAGRASCLRSGRRNRTRSRHTGANSNCNSGI